jgi:WD40 repeat protein
VNTTFAESAPALARKGLSLYFQSNRNGTLDLWVSRRNSVELLMTTRPETRDARLPGLATVVERR